MGELQGRPGRRALQRRRALRVADGEVGLAQRHLVHRAARRHADLPVPEAPGPVLDGRQRARLEYLDPRLGIAEPVERRCRVQGGPEVRPRERRAQQPQVGDDAVDPGVPEGRAKLVHGLLAVAADRDDLPEHRVVARRNLEAGLNPGVHPHARRRRRRPGDGGDQARAGAAAVIRILGVDAGLDRVAARDVPRRHELGDAVGTLAGQPQHLLDQVDPVHLLGDRVLHLQSGVHLQERRLLPDRVVHELDGPGRPVGDRRGQIPRRLVQLATQRRRQRGGRRLLDDLLVAALKRAVPVAEHHDLPGPVAEDLDLHVPGRPDQPLQEDAAGRRSWQRRAARPGRTRRPPRPRRDRRAGRCLPRRRSP